MRDIAEYMGRAVLPKNVVGRGRTASVHRDVGYGIGYRYPSYSRLCERERESPSSHLRKCLTCLRNWAEERWPAVT